jgi:hypothetical protein
MLESKKPFNVIPVKTGIQKMVILNSFQDLLQEMLKQAQHDKAKPGFPFSWE